VALEVVRPARLDRDTSGTGQKVRLGISHQPMLVVGRAIWSMQRRKRPDGGMLMLLAAMAVDTPG
jgi:hypothetical protein